MFTTVRGKKIYYEIEGVGEPLLLVHGWGGTSKSLKPLAELLSKSYKTILLDLPGFGQSEDPNPDWGVGEYTGFLEEFIETLNDQLPISNNQSKPKLFVVGHSFGGALGIQLAVNRPDMIEKLVLLAPSFKRSKYTPSLATRLLKPLFGHVPLVKIMYYKVFYPSSDLLKHPRLEPNFRKILADDLSDTVARVKAPTLILWGQTDKYVPVEDAKILNDKIEGSTLKIYEDKGHGLPLFHPQVVAEEIEMFLK